MEAGLTNKKPEVVANYYLDSLEKLKGMVISNVVVSVKNIR